MNLIIHNLIGSCTEIDISTVSNHVICLCVCVGGGLNSGVCIILFDLAREDIKLPTCGPLKKEVL